MLLPKWQKWCKGIAYFVIWQHIYLCTYSAFGTNVTQTFFCCLSLITLSFLSFLSLICFFLPSISRHLPKVSTTYPKLQSSAPNFLNPSLESADPAPISAPVSWTSPIEISTKPAMPCFFSNWDVGSGTLSFKHSYSGISYFSYGVFSKSSLNLIWWFHTM